MKKLIIFFVFLYLSINLFAQTGSSNRYAVQESMVVYDEATFEEGVDSMWYVRVGEYAPRFWTSARASYNYTPGVTGSIMSATTDSTDNMNYWDIFGNSDSVSGYTGYGDMDYQLYIPTSGKIYSWETWTSNYQNWNGYSNIQIKWNGWNSDSSKNVVMQALVFTQANGGEWLTLTPMLDRASNTIYTDTFSLGGFTSDQLSQISVIKFRVANNYISPGNANNCGHQRTFLYSIKLTNNIVPGSSTNIGNQTVTSHFLGTVFHKRYGSYSASGFYDTGTNNAGIFKIWFGGGTQDGDSQDNVWYVETPTLDPAALKDFDLRPVRCTITPTNILVNNNGEDWCWGDPSVIRFMSSSNPPASTYYMFVSALAINTTWNQIFRLTSIDGINWTLNPTTPVVTAANGGVAGYGTGSPSVVITQGYWWLWYYSQSESAGPGVYLRKSTDGLSWGSPIKTNVNSALDAKFVDSLNEFVAVSDVEAKGSGVYTLTSTDGISWNGGAPPYLSEDANAYLCHNPGLIGTDQGHGWSDMYATYGASQEAFGPTEYYTRELEYSSLHISSRPISAQTVNFYSKVDFTTGTGAYSVAIADVNGDGKPDIIAANQNNNNVSVLLNTTSTGSSTPSFSTKTDFTTGTNPYSVAIADVNGDGKPDIVVANVLDNTLSVLLNTTPTGSSTPSFSAKTDFTLGSSPVSVGIADVNGDGKPDIVVANHNDNTVSVLINTTQTGASVPSFSAKADFAVGNHPFSVAVADVNGDGKPDIVTANNSDSTVSVLLNTTSTGAATPTFSAKSGFAVGSRPYSVTTSDVNGDGKPDIIAANYGNNTVSVLLNTTPTGSSTVTFAAKSDFSTGATPYFVATADVNGDGKPDIVVTDLTLNTVSVLIDTTSTGSSTAAFSVKSDFSTGALPYSIAIADLNGDGKPDIVTANYTDNTVSVLLNKMEITSVKQGNNSFPANYSLSQNYPNPFNPSTEIKYSIAKSGLVTLKVYNLLGQEIATLVNQEQKTGNYVVNFDASKLASGIYIYRIQSGNFSLTKKMILLK